MNSNVNMNCSQHEPLSDGSTVITNLPLKALLATNRPTVLCFHGSGDGSAKLWVELIELLENDSGYILFDRSSGVPSVTKHIHAVREYLSTCHVPGPHILLAHSYGGTFAKQYLYQHREDVAGMVLVETGKSQEPTDIACHGPWNGGGARLSSRPLVVIRGNSLKANQRALDQVDQATVGNTTPQTQVMALQRRQMLVDAERQDGVFEKTQLQLSSRHKYVHLPDCGHNVIRDRPDVVKGEVEWVMDNLQAGNGVPPTNWISRRMGWKISTSFRR